MSAAVWSSEDPEKLSVMFSLGSLELETQLRPRHRKQTLQGWIPAVWLSSTSR